MFRSICTPNTTTRRLSIGGAPPPSPAITARSLGQQQQIKQSMMNKLPSIDLWVMVLRWLSVPEALALARVSRDMYAITKDRAFWRKATFDDFGNRLPPLGWMPKVFAKMSELRELSFKSFYGPMRQKLLQNSDVVIQQIASNCNQIRVANLLGFCISANALDLLARSSPHLEELYISQSNITDANLATLVRACPQLRVLNIAHCQRISDSGMQYIATLGKLRALSLSDTVLSDSAIKNLAEGNLSKLEVLYLSFTNITDHTLTILANKAASLKHLQVHGCRFTDEALKMALRGELRHLTHLDISGSPTVGDFALCEVKSTSLRAITLSSAPNITTSLKMQLVQQGVKVVDIKDFCGELVEAEVSPDVYGKLELLAFHNSFVSVEDFVRVYMQHFLDQASARGRPFPSAPTFASSLQGHSPQQSVLPSHTLVPNLVLEDDTF